MAQCDQEPADTMLRAGARATFLSEVMSRIEGFMQKRTETFSGKASPAWRSGSRSSVAAYLVAAYSDAEAINQPRPQPTAEGHHQKCGDGDSDHPRWRRQHRDASRRNTGDMTSEAELPLPIMFRSLPLMS